MNERGWAVGLGGITPRRRERARGEDRRRKQQITEMNCGEQKIVEGYTKNTHAIEQIKTNPHTHAHTKLYENPVSPSVQRSMKKNV